tara:strand:+ start:387 stop:641 length:255 start_codon:yes stop_codon:yes gene_type:complete
MKPITKTELKILEGFELLLSKQATYSLSRKAIEKSRDLVKTELAIKYNTTSSFLDDMVEYAKFKKINKECKKWLKNYNKKNTIK